MEICKPRARPILWVTETPPPLNRHQDEKHVQRMRMQSGNLKPNTTKQNVNRNKNDRTRNKHDKIYVQNMKTQQGNVNPNASKQYVSIKNTKTTETANPSCCTACEFIKYDVDMKYRMKANKAVSSTGNKNKRYNVGKQS